MNWTYEEFKKAIYEITLIDLSSYKERQMKRRIDALISRNQYSSYNTYYNALLRDKSLLNQFTNYLTINVSEFYRNPSQWDMIEKEIMPSLINKHKNIKIWSAACSTGEEPYSMAMLMTRFLPLESIKILATDIDKEVIEKAKIGMYLEKSLESLPDEFKTKYFHKHNDMFEIDERIKSTVEFRHHNLLKDKYPENCHFILCRNVMIYFTEEAKVHMYGKFHDALHRDGILFVGSTEQIILPHRYNLQSIKTFFYKRMCQQKTF